MADFFVAFDLRAAAAVAVIVSTADQRADEFGDVHQR